MRTIQYFRILQLLTFYRTPGFAIMLTRGRIFQRTVLMPTASARAHHLTFFSGARLITQDYFIHLNDRVTCTHSCGIFSVVLRQLPCLYNSPMFLVRRILPPPPTLQPPFSKPTYIFIIASPLVRVPRGKRVHCGEINPLFYSTVQ